jgi:hypothetical protein|tara:strand:+ start:154 stop:1128 length:975 start_codon:yes stop_codon:yes gene_type:complete
MVDEFLFHYSELTRQNKRSQQRLEDSKSNDVATLAAQILQDGQEHGICILEEDGTNLVIWGNTRLKAIQRLASQGLSFHELGKGEIWASYYCGDIHEMRTDQAKENNIHKFAKPARIEDNVKSICDMISCGDMNDNKYGKSYNNLTDVEQRVVAVSKMADCHMPSTTAVWNRVKKSSKLSQSKKRTWEKHEMAAYFGNNNNYGINKNLLVDFNESCERILTADNGKRIGLYMITNACNKGATLAQAQYKKNVYKYVDEIVLLVALNPTTSNAMPSIREQLIVAVQQWNKSSKANTVDRMLFVPQTEDEQDNELISGDFALDKVL